VVAVDSDSSYRYLGTGEPLALEISGPSVEACLARAVEGFTAAFADVHPCIVPTGRPLAIDASDPSAMLRALLDAAIGLTAGGELAVSVCDLEVRGRRLTGSFDAVPATWAALTTTLPLAVSWSDLSLACHDGQWIGRVVARV
jgi:Archease protein family (MTH1598/TM1083)